MSIWLKTVKEISVQNNMRTLIEAWPAAFSEKLRWRSIEQVCQGVKYKAAWSVVILFYVSEHLVANFPAVSTDIAENIIFP